MSEKDLSPAFETGKHLCQKNIEDVIKDSRLLPVKEILFNVTK
ncbi:hypothetical protein CLU96_1337 [Chryseobacterium sp. 52]|nr:hypothetical protein CLU96_1337 [Chryseobacterium sp. 52]